MHLYNVKHNVRTCSFVVTAHINQISVSNPLRISLHLNLTSAGNGVYSRSVILHNGPCAAFNSQNAGNLENDILWGSPTRQRSGQSHSYHLRENDTGWKILVKQPPESLLHLIYNL